MLVKFDMCVHSYNHHPDQDIKLVLTNFFPFTYFIPIMALLLSPFYRWETKT